MVLGGCHRGGAKEWKRGLEPHSQPPKSPAEKRLLEEAFGKIFTEPEPRGLRCARGLLRGLKRVCVSEGVLAGTTGALFFAALGLSVRSQILKFGEDWVFLFLLGISMATLSFGLDVVVSKCQQANLWVYDELVGSHYLQYFSWTSYHVSLMVVSAAAAKYISPQAAGSGIPELKVALRGVMLHEFFTVRTFVAKLVGVICTLAGGSTIFLGKVGPFVHMATILATQLGKVMVWFAGSRENPARKYELLIAGAAVGVACCFVAPVGGVLFGVEATGTHFAVRDYWRGFFAATCAALTFRLLAVLYNTEETVAVLFRTSWRVEFPYDLPELLSYAILGILCGVLCCVFLFCHRNILMVIQNWPKINRFMVNNKIVYSGAVTLLLASLTFPHALGQYIGARLSMKQLLETFFNNMTWGLEEAFLGNATRQHPNASDGDGWLQWTHPDVSMLEMLSIFLVAKFLMLLVATTMIVPAGYFLPVFVYGAGLGRLYGEVMAKIFPDGIISDGIHIQITPAGYALAGAAAYSGAVTQTISTALLTFELTGQMSHILPVLVAVLIANAISQRAQPSFFDGIILVKKLPFLPKLSLGKSGGHDIYAEDFMVTNLKYLTRESKFKDLRTLLKVSSLKEFPLVDSEESRVLLGSVKRKCLSDLLLDQLSAEKRFQYMLSQSDGAARTQELELGGHEEKSEKFETSKETRGSSFDAAETSLTKDVEEEPLRSAAGSGDHPSEREKRMRYYNMVEAWECQQLQETVRLDALTLDPAPYRLLEEETLYQCYNLFNLLGLHIAYVTNMGRLVGVVGLKELKSAVEGCVKGTFTSRARWHSSRPADDQELKSLEEAKRGSSLA
ncbi:chloride channel protein ClC-Kb-like [Eublepharis macularius]|uniref:Chloride channel protein ClC-Kb-like n=1 Tax=Eublepharis macularius TaxID=481883 RepID=A0AA97K6B0_EUBMA|nr:chloride channel protein ClC-Kb-like [Eublepharis macularius]